MVLHIRSLDEETLANRVYTQQKENNWPGLVEETKRICEELKIKDCKGMDIEDFVEIVILRYDH